MEAASSPLQQARIVDGMFLEPAVEWYGKERGRSWTGFVRSDG